MYRFSQFTPAEGLSEQAVRAAYELVAEALRQASQSAGGQPRRCVERRHARWLVGNLRQAHRGLATGEVVPPGETVWRLG